MPSRFRLRLLALPIGGFALALAFGTGCVGSTEIPEPGTYATESPAEAMEEEEEAAAYRDMNR